MPLRIKLSLAINKSRQRVHQMMQVCTRCILAGISWKEKRKLKGKKDMHENYPYIIYEFQN